MTTAPRSRRGASASLMAVLAAGILTLAGAAGAQQEFGLLTDGPRTLGYQDYVRAMRAAERLDHVASVESLEDADGPVLAVGDRFGLVRLIHVTGAGARALWTSKQLTGMVQEVLSADLDGDGSDEVIAWTSAASLYVWSAGDGRLRYETLQNDFQVLHGLCVGDVDDDAALELVVNADRHIYYIDGINFIREWTSLNEYEATRIAVGDVDGDKLPEIVLNTGQVLNSRSGDLKWGDEVFGARIELLDVDGDGILEVLTESDAAVMKIYDVDVRREKHLQ